MARKPKVLLVEDSPSLAALYREFLRPQGLEVTHTLTGTEGQRILASELPDAMLLDLHLPDINGMDILQQVHEQQLPVPVVVITAHGSVDAAVEAMRYGAFDFLVKPFDAERLRVTVKNVLEHQRLATLVDDLKDTLLRDRFAGFIGGSPAMQRVYQMIESAAPSNATVFVTGESGTGKELCAEAVHKLSPRRDAELVVLNCAAIPRDLMESEIFGHVKGAFTGAHSAREGAASRADGGTLFLDEIGEMDLDLQSKLLRFIQSGTFTKVGGSTSEKVDLRFVCATNRDPLEEVHAGRFREDLYYRLHVIPVHLPSLRERDDDVLLIARDMLRRLAHEEGKGFTSLSSDCEQVLLDYDWPGNVRELQNVLRNAVVLNDGPTLAVAMLPPSLNGGSTSSRPPRASAPTAVELTPSRTEPSIRPLWQIEKDAIEAAIAHTGGNIPRAAALLEVSPSTLYRKKQRWEN